MDQLHQQFIRSLLLLLLVFTTVMLPFTKAVTKCNTCKREGTPLADVMTDGFRCLDAQVQETNCGGDASTFRCAVIKTAVERPPVQTGDPSFTDYTLTKGCVALSAFTSDYAGASGWPEARCSDWLEAAGAKRNATVCLCTTDNCNSVDFVQMMAADAQATTVEAEMISEETATAEPPAAEDPETTTKTGSIVQPFVQLIAMLSMQKLLW